MTHACTVSSGSDREISWLNVKAKSMKGICGRHATGFTFPSAWTRPLCCACSAIYSQQRRITSDSVNELATETETSLLPWLISATGQLSSSWPLRSRGFDNNAAYASLITLLIASSFITWAAVFITFASRWEHCEGTLYVFNADVPLELLKLIHGVARGNISAEICSILQLWSLHTTLSWDAQ